MGKSALLWDELAGHDVECKACSAVNEVAERPVEPESSIAETINITPGGTVEPLPLGRRIRKRRDVTLL
jgi:hypothetical protein